MVKFWFLNDHSVHKNPLANYITSIQINFNLIYNVFVYLSSIVSSKQEVYLLKNVNDQIKSIFPITTHPILIFDAFLFLVGLSCRFPRPTSLFLTGFLPISISIAPVFLLSRDGLKAQLILAPFRGNSLVFDESPGNWQKRLQS